MEIEFKHNGKTVARGAFLAGTALPRIGETVTFLLKDDVDPKDGYASVDGKVEDVRHIIEATGESLPFECFPYSHPIPVAPPRAIVYLSYLAQGRRKEE